MPPPPLTEPNPVWLGRFLPRVGHLCAATFSPLGSAVFTHWAQWGRRIEARHVCRCENSVAPRNRNQSATASGTPEPHPSALDQSFTRGRGIGPKGPYV